MNRETFNLLDLKAAGPAPNCSPLLVPGEKVVLNSGGLTLTVENVLEGGKVLLSWTTSAGYQTTTFPAICVHRVSK